MTDSTTNTTNETRAVRGRPAKQRSFSLMKMQSTTAFAVFFNRMRSAVERDLGGRSDLSHVERSLIHAYCGAYARLQCLDVRAANSANENEIDTEMFSAYSTLASTMLRIGVRLGLNRRQRDITPSLGEYLSNANANADAEDAK